MVDPAFHTGPESTKTLGPEVAELCGAVHYAPDLEQRLVLDAVFAMNSAGKVASFEMAVIAARQNLKSGAFKQCALGWLFVSELAGLADAGRAERRWGHRHRAGDAAGACLARASRRARP